VGLPQNLNRIGMYGPKILVMAGSLRAGSHNGRLAALVAKELALAEAQVTRISLADYPLPLLDADVLADSGPPDHAVKLKRMLSAHQGVFIASPEYTASVTPLLKNAIDWVTRVRERNEAPYAAFKDRVFAIGSASARADGGLHALAALRQILQAGCGALVLPEQINVGRADAAFDDMDNLNDDALTAVLKEMVQRLIDLASVMPKATE
jgi:NAD(P)H-dependent FMN reductase